MLYMWKNVQSAASRKSFISCLGFFFIFGARYRVGFECIYFYVYLCMLNENLNFVLFKWCDERPHMLVCNCYSYVYLCLHACYSKIVKIVFYFGLFLFQKCIRALQPTVINLPMSMWLPVICICIFWFLNWNLPSYTLHI